MGLPWDKYIKGKVTAVVTALTADRTITFPNSDLDLGKVVNLSNSDSVWTAVSSFANSWGNFDSSETTWFKAKYRKTPTGEVMLRGLISGGTMGAAAFTLPSGYRPSKKIAIATDANGVHGLIYIESGGNVIPQSGNNAAFSIEVRFFPD